MKPKVKFKNFKISNGRKFVLKIFWRRNNFEQLFVIYHGNLNRELGKSITDVRVFIISSFANRSINRCFPITKKVYQNTIYTILFDPNSQNHSNAHIKKEHKSMKILCV